MLQLLCLAVIFASSTVSVAAGGGGGSQRWKYVDDPDETTWAPLCRVGTHQSPIDIVTTKLDRLNASSCDASAFELHNYEKVWVTGENDGRSLNFYPMEVEEALNKTQITGGPLKQIYILHSIHCHWPSEHTVNGIRFPFEVHYVHHRIDLSMEKAITYPDGLAVVAVMAAFDPENKKECQLKELVEEVQQLSEADSSTTLRQLNLRNMMSSSPSSYYTYPGSLTTPGCDEAVIWIVQKEQIFTTKDQVQHFRNADLHRGYGCNSRAVKPANGRPVLSYD